MKYIKLTLQYLKGKHFFKLLLASILPAVLLSFLKTFSNTSKYIVNFSSKTSTSFGDIFLDSTNFSWQGALKSIGAILIMSITVAYFVGTIIRHMRTGKLDMSRAFSRINDNFLAVLRLILVIAFGLILFGILNSLFIFMWSRIARGTAWLVILLSLMTLFILSALLVILLALLSLWVPAMALTGQPAIISLSTSIRGTLDNSFKSFIIAVALPLIPCFLIEYLMSLTKITALIILGDFIFFEILILYYPVFVVASYHEVLQLDREDLLAKNRL